MHNDRIVMVHFKPGECMIMVFLQPVTQAYSVKNFQVLPTGVKPMTSGLLVRMLYH